MTARELVRLVRLWQRRLALDHWRIEVVVDRARWAEQAPHQDAYAFVWRARDYDVARVYLNPAECYAWSPRQAAEHVVHELVHLVLRELELVLSLVDEQLHRDVHAVVEGHYRRAMEGAVDRLALQLVALEHELQPRRAVSRSKRPGGRTPASARPRP